MLRDRGWFSGLGVGLSLVLCAHVRGWAQTGVAVGTASGGDSWRGLVLPNVIEPYRAPRPVAGLPLRPEAVVEHVREAIGTPAGDPPRRVWFRDDGALVVAFASGAFRRRSDGSWESEKGEGLELPGRSGVEVTGRAQWGGDVWYGTLEGLYRGRVGSAEVVRHEAYGVDGPLATRVTALVVDSKGRLWVGTPLGLSVRSTEGSWRHYRGREGLPVEAITALAVTPADELWIGTQQGGIWFRPESTGRQWYYRWGRRYLPDNDVSSVACGPDGTPYFVTRGGLSRLAVVRTTLRERAEEIERRVGLRHRRMGLVAACMLKDAERPDEGHSISDNDNDGLWTAYHVAALSLCHAVTGEPAARASAKQGMEALYLLQDISGTPGLVARSVLPAAEGAVRGAQWRPSPDGRLYWKSDTSSDEIDGHYLAFFAYWEHVAKGDPAERERCIRHVRALTDHLIRNDYQLIDWTGRRTRWGFWNPANLNASPEHYLENGLNSLQIMSFLKVAHHITGESSYREHYRRLIVEHGYLGNVLLQKKVFPDEHNHSDDQLGFVAWYPILQLERDPAIRRVLESAVARHHAVVAPERPSFYSFVYGTVDPGRADLSAGIGTLAAIPTDRRTWAMRNSHRADVVFEPMEDRFGRRQLQRVLPADERCFEKWNANPYLPDGGGDGREEDDGAAYLLPYWMARYHGFLAAD